MNTSKKATRTVTTLGRIVRTWAGLTSRLRNLAGPASSRSVADVNRRDGCRVIESIADLVAFLQRFHRHWLDEPSLDEDLIPADLPDGLALIYRRLGALVELEDAPGPFAAQDGLVPLSRLKRVNGMVEFARENQNNWSARCPAGRPDPPVFSNAADVWAVERRGYVVVCESLNHFLTTLCLQEAVMSCRHLLALDADRPPNEVLSIPLRPLWLDGYYVSEEPDHHYFVSADEDVLVMQSRDDLWVGSPVNKLSGLVTRGARVQRLR
jgi:hypothetical protein